MKSTATPKSQKAKSAKPAALKSRVRATPRHRTLRLSTKRLRQPQSIPSAVSLFKNSLSVLRKNKRLFVSIVLLNAILSFAFIKGFGSTFDIVEVKQSLSELVDGQSDQFGTAFALFGYLVGSAGSSASEGAGVYQFFFTLVTALALIWAIRQIQAGEKPNLRDCYYKGMYPLIPFILVLFVIGIQLLPLLLGNLLYSTVMQNGLAVTMIEQAVWLLLFLLLALLSGYMLISSIFSMYIVTLPDMTPLRALRSAREVVLHRRLAVTLRIIALPIILAIISALLFVPLIIVAAPAVEVLFLLVTGIGLVLFQTYMYLLYRSLL